MVAAKRKKPIPFDFVLEELAIAEPYTKPMFGLTGVYIGDKIIFALRNKEEHPSQNGVWLATQIEHHESLRKIFPNMKSHALFGDGGQTGWQILPSDSDDFEESVLTACQLALNGDPRIGKVPKSKSIKNKSTKKKKKSKKLRHK